MGTEIDSSWENQRLKEENEKLRRELAELGQEFGTEHRLYLHCKHDLAEAVAAMRDVFPAAHRLALELECVLLECKDTAAVSKWWDTAHEALEQWREFCREDKTHNAMYTSKPPYNALTESPKGATK